MLIRQASRGVAYPTQRASESMAAEKGLSAPESESRAHLACECAGAPRGLALAHAASFGPLEGEGRSRSTQDRQRNRGRPAEPLHSGGQRKHGEPHLDDLVVGFSPLTSAHSAQHKLAGPLRNEGVADAPRRLHRRAQSGKSPCAVPLRESRGLRKGSRASSRPASSRQEVAMWR